MSAGEVREPGARHDKREGMGVQRSGSGAAETYCVAIALFLGLTFLRGGVEPSFRWIIHFFALSAFPVRSFVSGWKRNETRYLFLWPAGVYFAALLLAPIPSLGYDLTLQVMAGALFAAVFSARLDYRILASAFLAASLVLGLSVFLEVAENLRRIGAPAWGLGGAGLLRGANVTAIVLSAAISLATISLLHGGAVSRGERVFLGAVLLVGLAALVLTDSRSGYLALLCGWCVAAWLLPPLWRFRLVAAALLIAVAAFLLYRDRFLAKLSLHYITNEQRFSMWSAALQGIRDHPLLGNGPWSFAVIGMRYQSWPKWELHPHSLPLCLLFETGIFGFGVIATAVLAAVVTGIRRKRYSALAALAALAGGSVAEDILWIPAVLFGTFLLLGGLLSAEEVSLANSTTSSRTGARFEFVLRTIAFAACAAALLFPVAWARYGTRLSFPVPPVVAIDRAVEANETPEFRGWREDPVARRVAGYIALRRGKVGEAEALFRGALERDPMMVFAPHVLDLARVWSSVGRRQDADRLLQNWRDRAPALIGWYLGETTPVWSTSFVDWNFRIENPCPGSADWRTIPPYDDPMHWKHYRFLAGRALAAVDTPAARAALKKALYLSVRQYGIDAVLCRMAAEVDSDPSRAEAFLVRGRSRLHPVVPYRYIAPMIYRLPTRSGGENSDWWREWRNECTDYAPREKEFFMRDAETAERIGHREEVDEGERRR
ncbi:MAG: hypothetical protein D6679_01015 [Candidatus Hydrogenedentota bacterium]|nr:MAG: hypothetical protein D6679_01015 [Candidatus Hydrogenedentota bacterium]